MLAIVALLASGLVVLGPPPAEVDAAPPAPVTGAFIDSEAYAYVGDGQQWVYPAEQVLPFPGTPGALTGNHAQFSVDTYPHESWIWFSTPESDTKFSVGTFEGAERYGSGSPDKPGLDVFVNGRACDPITGRFIVDEVTYSGDTIVTFSARFEMSCPNSGNPWRVFGALSYKATAPYRTRTIAPSSLRFPTVHAGATTPSQTVTISNDGPAALHNAGVTLTGTNASDFAITADGCLGAALSQGQSCSVSVAFAPSGSPVGPPGGKNAELRVFDELAPIGGSGRAIALNGSSTTWTISPASLDFGDVPVGFVGVPQTLTFTNDGPTTLYPHGVTIDGSDQWVVTDHPDCLTPPGSVPPGGSCAVSIAFAPTGSAGPRATTASFVDTNVNPFGHADISGYATARSWVVVPSTLSFSATIASAPTTQPLTVTNNGTVPLVIANAVVVGPGAAAFAVTPRPACFSPGSIAAGASCTVPVTFSPPGTVSTSTATVSLVDPLGNVFGVTSLVGTTTDPFGEFTGVTPARVFDTRDGTGQGGVPGSLPAGGVRAVQITGQGGMPAAGVAAVVMNVTVTDTSSWGWLRVWPSGETEPTVSNLNWGAGQTVANLVTVPVGLDGKVSIRSANSTAGVIFDVVGSYALSDGGAGSRFHGITPVRFLDTRVPGTPIGPGATLSMKFTGAGGVPSSGVTAVALNVTVTQPTSWGWLTVYPGDAAKPLASSLNFFAGQTVANMVIVRVPADGIVKIYNQFGTTQVIADVMGYYDLDRSTEAGRFVPVSPDRAFDSRVDWGFPIPPDNGVIITWFDQNGQPLTTLGGIVANVTATQPTSDGWITAFPLDATSIPWVSNLNFSPGATVPNQVMVRTSQPNLAGVPSASVAFYNPYGFTHLIVDLFGFFTNANVVLGVNSSTAAAAATGGPLGMETASAGVGRF